jgi:hypothetical protein
MAKLSVKKPTIKPTTAATTDAPKMCAPSATCGGGGALYFVGFIGALVYYVQTSIGFWGVVLGVLKAFVWPAMLVYKLLGV